jgi:hypothetical protein
MRVCAWSQDTSNSGPPQQALDGRRVGDGILPTRRDSLYFRQNFERGQERDYLLKELSCVENGSPTGVSGHAACDATQQVRRRRLLFLGGLRDTGPGYPRCSVSHLRELGVLVRSRFPGGTLARGLAVLLNMLVVISEVDGVDGGSYLRRRRTVRVVLPSGTLARGLAVLLNMLVVISEVDGVDGGSYLRRRRTVRVVLPSGSHTVIQCDRGWRC